MCLCCDLKCNRTKTLKCNIFYLLLSSIRSCEGSLIQLFLFIEQWAFIVFTSSILWMYVFVLWLEMQSNKNFEVQYFLSFVKFHSVLWSVFDPIISIHWTMSIHSISKLFFFRCMCLCCNLCVNWLYSFCCGLCYLALILHL